MNWALLALSADKGTYIPPSLRGPMGLVTLIVLVAAYIVLTAMSPKSGGGNESTKPEEAPPAPTGGPWKCPKCGEELEPQFGSCWKCGTVRTTGPAA
jgi:hypothetical protein